MIFNDFPPSENIFEVPLVIISLVRSSLLDTSLLHVSDGEQSPVPCEHGKFSKLQHVPELGVSLSYPAPVLHFHRLIFSVKLGGIVSEPS